MHARRPLRRRALAAAWIRLLPSLIFSGTVFQELYLPFMFRNCSFKSLLQNVKFEDMCKTPFKCCGQSAY